MNALLDEYIERVASAEPFNSVQIFHHNDADGVCAAASAHAFIAKKYPDALLRAEWLGTHQFNFQTVRDYLETHSGSLVLCFDINFFSKPGFLSYLTRHRNNSIVIVDDHRPNEHVEGVATILLNPNLGAANLNVELPPSLFAYLATSRIGLHLPEWLPAIGLLADRQLDTYRHLFADLPSNRQLQTAIIELTSIYLSPETSNSQNIPLSFLLDQIRSDHSWDDFCAALTRNDKLNHARRDVQTVIEGALSQAIETGPSESLKGGHNILVFKQSNKYRITNILASRLSAINPEAIVIAVRQEWPDCFFEIRVGQMIRNHDIVALLKRVSIHVPLHTFGGHARAAGGSCSLTTFEQMVTEYVGLDRTT
jgi:single-stranded DNA-specific DHH superfamily exonuclease